MAVYVRVTPDQVLQYDFGYSLSGEVYNDRAMKIPHDLTGYDRVLLKTSREGIGEMDFNSSPVSVLSGDGNEHRWSWRIPRGSFFYEGVFNLYLTLQSAGLSRTTIPARLLVRETAQSSEDVA